MRTCYDDLVQKLGYRIGDRVIVKSLDEMLEAHPKNYINYYKSGGVQKSKVMLYDNTDSEFSCFAHDMKYLIGKTAIVTDMKDIGGGITEVFLTGFGVDVDGYWSFFDCMLMPILSRDSGWL